MKKLTLLMCLFSVSARAGELLGTVQAKGMFIKDRIEVVGFDDPTMDGISCYTTRYVYTMTLRDDSTESSLSCRRVKPKVTGNFVSKLNIFEQDKGFLSFYKETVVDRFYDSKRNVMVYLSYTKSWGSKNTAHSVSVVPLGE